MEAAAYAAACQRAQATTMGRARRRRSLTWFVVIMRKLPFEAGNSCFLPTEVMQPTVGNKYRLLVWFPILILFRNNIKPLF